MTDPAITQDFLNLSRPPQTPCTGELGELQDEKGETAPGPTLGELPKSRSSSTCIRCYLISPSPRWTFSASKGIVAQPPTQTRRPVPIVVLIVAGRARESPMSTCRTDRPRPNR